LPLAFDTINAGTVAFGYFNIDTDLLLLDRQFFFSGALCKAVSGLAEGATERDVEGYAIDDPADVGNVMGAIHGVDRSGFIGAVYGLYPFPARREDFWQRAAGEDHRAEIEPLLERWARPTRFGVRWRPEVPEVVIGELRFEPAWFRELVAYVWRGGYPRWLDDRRPDCVVAMREAIERSSHPLFADQPWDLTQRPC